MSDLIKGILEWATKLIDDLVNNRKSVEEVRAECKKAGILITETAAEAELAEYDKATGASDR